VQEWAKDEFRDILAESYTAGYSCERMARDLCIRARSKYRCAVTVEIDEDGENSAQVSL
jgi:hypothetical protein